MLCVIINLAGLGFQKACMVANAASFMFGLVSSHNAPCSAVTTSSKSDVSGTADVDNMHNQLHAQLL